jgi:hypothetical protein
MNRRSLALFAAVAAFLFVGAQGAAAHEIKPAVKTLLNTILSVVCRGGSVFVRGCARRCRA